MKSLLLIAALLGPADFGQAMLVISGVSCAEELSGDEVLRYQALAEHPLDINLSGESRLRASGLFSDFQLASFLDYRRESGDVLSFAELGLIDGFSPEFAEALAFFVSLKTSSPPGHRQRTRFRNSLTLKASARQSGELAGGIRYEASLGEAAELRWTTRTTYTNPKLEVGTISAAFYGRRSLGKLVIGHYAARFGQGLVAWSGFSMSGYSSAESFCRKAGGISVTGAADAEFLGIGSDWILGNYCLSAALSADGKGSVVNFGRSWRRASASVTAGLRAASVDWRLAFPDGSVFGEAACTYSGEPSIVAGAQWIPQYARKFSLLARWYAPSVRSYSGLAAGIDSPSFLATADSGFRRDRMSWQHRLLVVFRPGFSIGLLELTPSLRLSGRIRPSEKNPRHLGLRTELRASYGRFMLEGRYDAVWCSSFGWLCLAGAGFRTEALDIRLRVGLFRIDNWADRIYVYEHDAPGNFNVPAYYGRGRNASVYMGWHINKAHSLWLRASMVDYSGNPEPKEGRTELKLQYRWRL